MKIKKFLPLILICVFMSGCWDKVEIDKQSFISTIAIDKGKEINKEKELINIKPGDTFLEEKIKKLYITYGFPDISELGPGKSNVLKEKSISVDAYSMDNGIQEATAKSSRSIRFGHTKLLILGSELLQYPNTIKEVIDYLDRQPSLNRNMITMVAKGTAEDYVKFIPAMESNIENYIIGLAENNKNTMMKPLTLKEVLTSLINNDENVLIPTMELDKVKNELSLVGTSIIKNYKIIGNLDKSQSYNVQLIKGDIKGGNKVIYINGHPINFSIYNIKRKIKMDNSKNKIKFNIDLEMEGQLKQSYVGNELFYKDSIQAVENNLNKTIKKECEETFRVVQKQYNVDVFGLGDYMKKFHPYTWKKFKGNWDEVFNNVDINVNVNFKVRRVGVIK
ncbi:spore germination protein A3 precursor [Clostridium acetireducens DSM 10703]|uniref:Spore germination protein A3 n=1 Tax=Clostridium acetireducens DSM 10703 TaxID=1121290 RepID=A0A1E8EYY1_9CLOT|nr:Ger(x)C family spore germination protein [Clostridium acetireducens]OFI06183.1 spore germination protein A3 precursor [Clostridium acetireducens DSM 10703]